MDADKLYKLLWDYDICIEDDDERDAFVIDLMEAMAADSGFYGDLAARCQQKIRKLEASRDAALKALNE